MNALEFFTVILSTMAIINLSIILLIKMETAVFSKKFKRNYIPFGITFCVLHLLFMLVNLVMPNGG